MWLSMEVSSYLTEYTYYTPYGLVNIPPPLCACSVRLEMIPSAALIIPCVSDNLRVLLFNKIKDGIEVVDFDYKLKGATETKTTRGFKLEKSKFVFEENDENISNIILRDAKFIKNNEIIAVGYNSKLDCDFLFKINVEEEKNFRLKIFPLNCLILRSTIKDGIIYQSIDGSMNNLNLHEINSNLLNIEIPLIRQMESLPNSDYVLSISYDNELYMNHIKVSFIIKC